MNLKNRRIRGTRREGPMQSLAAAPLHRQRQIVLTACLAIALMAGQAVGGDIVVR